MAKALLENVDKELMKEKGRSLKVERLLEHRIITVFGDVRVKRRLYRDINGDYHFLLDEKMGLNGGCHTSPKVKEQQSEVLVFSPQVSSFAIKAYAVWRLSALR